MASLQAHALDLVVRALFKRTMHKNLDLASVRRTLEGGKLPAPKPPNGVTFTPGEVGGIAGEWVRRLQAAGQAARTLLYLHGGGYFACSPRTHRPLTAAFAKHGFQVFGAGSPAGARAPCPAAVEDAAATWRGLVAEGRAPQSMAVAGHSAGGGLSLALMLTLRDAGEAQPGAAALFSPWTDLAGTGESVRTNARRDAMFWAPGLSHGASHYSAGGRPTTRSPRHCMPTCTGCRRCWSMRATARYCATTARAWPSERVPRGSPSISVSGRWYRMSGQLAPFVPEARESVDLASAFLTSHCT